MATDATPRRGKAAPRPRPPAPAVPLPESCPTLLSRAQVAAAIGVTGRQINYLIARGEFPRAELDVGERPRWKTETLRAWIEQRSAAKRAGV